MAYVALYRRWRPQDFDALVGQQAVKTALSNALTSGRIAHAYLFSGPRGTGKTSTARILAKALNCENGPTPHPCGHCLNCERITAGTSMDVFEIDAASNRGIEEIKSLREQLAFAPVNGRYKIYIIDEVHMLTTEAFNALLKTLEEPPAHVIFILATTDPHRIPATIHSRCQRFDFRRVTVDEIAEHLALVAEKSGINADVEALRLIAIQAEGGMRDALSLLDQCGVMAQQVTVQTVREVLGIVGREALRELVLGIGRQDVPQVLEQLNNLLQQGKDVKQILTELTEYLRALLLYQAAPSYQEAYLTDTAEELAKCVPLFSRDRIMAAQQRLHEAIGELRWTMRPRITAELCLFDLCRMEGSTVAALAARVEMLERQLRQQPSMPLRREDEAASPATMAVPLAGQQGNYSEPVQAAAVAAVKPVQKSIAEDAQAKPQPVKSKPKKEAVQEYGGDWATGEEYWKKALEILTAEKKIAMVSCARGGRVVNFDNGLLQVAFKAKFICARMNKDDYRLVFEDALLRTSRQNIRLECIEAGTAVKASPKPKEQPAEDKLPEVDVSTVAPNLQKAMAAFGKSLYEYKDNE